MTDLDELTKRLDGIVSEIDKQLRHRVTIESHDGDDGEIDASDPSADDDYDNNPGEDDYLDDEEDDTVQKATINAAVMRNDPTNRPGDLPSSSHTSSSNSRHKFDAQVDRLVNEEGLTRSEAMSQARARYPELYRSYVGSASFLNKAAPGSFESLVSEQMAKGCSTYEQAAQRVVQQYGYRALDRRDMRKSEAISVLAEAELMSKANDRWRDDPTLTRTDALRAARQDHPSLYRRMNR
jgi:hypothetical protein